MMLLILGVTAVVYIATLGFISYQLRMNAINEARNLADVVAQQKASEISVSLNEDMAVSRLMALVVQEYTALPEELRNDLRRKLLVNVIKAYPKYDATWMSWELSAIDPEWELPYGRERTNFYMRDGEVQASQELANLEGDNSSGIYVDMKRTGYVKEGYELLSEPYWYEDYDYSTDSGDSLLGVSPTASHFFNGKFAGVIGTDMTVSDFGSMSNVSFYEDGYAFLLTNQGTIISHKDISKFSLPVDSLDFMKGRVFSEMKEELIAMEKGKTVSFTTYDESFGDEVYVTFARIIAGRTDTPWFAGIIVPVSEITSAFNQAFLWTLLVGVIGLVALTLVVGWLASGITNSLDQSNSLLKDLARGNLVASNKIKVTGKDEISQIAESVNTLLHEMNKKAKFSRKIGEGNLDAEFESAGENDVLGESLLVMRDNLRRVIADTSEAVQLAGFEGNFSKRMELDGKKGAWKEMSISINALLES